MPYEHRYIPAPKNMSLEVFKELPKPFVEETRIPIFGVAIRTARDSEWNAMYFCNRTCGGWIHGHTNEYRINTLDPSHLAGRQGTEYYCRRCGEELAFDGMVS